MTPQAEALVQLQDIVRTMRTASQKAVSVPFGSARERHYRHIIEELNGLADELLPIAGVSEETFQSMLQASGRRPC